MKPYVAGSEKLIRSFRWQPPQVHLPPIAVNHTAVHKVLSRLTGEELARQLGQRRVVIEERRAGRREVTVGSRFSDPIPIAVILGEARIRFTSTSPGMRLTGGIGPPLAQTLLKPAEYMIWITGSGCPRQWSHEDPGGGGADHNPFTTVGEGEAEGVGAAYDRLDVCAVGLEAKVTIGQVDRLSQSRPCNPATTCPGTHVHPTIRSILRLVDVPLQDPCREAVKERLTDFCDAISIAVRQEKHCRSSHRYQAITCRHDPVAGWETICKHHRPVHHPVAIIVVQSFNRAICLGLRSLLGIIRGLDATHLAIEQARLVELLDVCLTFEVVAVELAHIESPLGIPTDARRFADQGLGGHQLHLQACGQAKALLGVRRRKRPGGICWPRNLCRGHDPRRHRRMITRRATAVAGAVDARSDDPPVRRAADPVDPRAAHLTGIKTGERALVWAGLWRYLPQGIDDRQQARGTCRCVSKERCIRLATFGCVEVAADNQATVGCLF